MESPLPVLVNFDDYRHTYPQYQSELKQFERIVKNYRFFKGDFESAYHVQGFKRNAAGVFEIALLEYGIEIVFKKYGSKSPNPGTLGGYSMDQFQVKDLIKKFKNDLINMDLMYPRTWGRSADNVSLLASLFQYQSDDNKVMDVNEATEFGLSLFSAIFMSEKLTTHFKEQRCRIDSFDRIEPKCFRENFWAGFCQKYYTYYPKMFQYLGASSCRNLKNTELSQEFLDRSIKAARACNYYTAANEDAEPEEIYYSESDIMTILLAISHAETTVLRWDINNNNILEWDEADEAYPIYSTALDGFLENKPAIVKRFKYEIYKHLMKYETIPDEDAMVRSGWTLWRLRNDVSMKATRKTITSVLWAIGEENKKISKDPPFNCNWLRDPSKIPRED